MRVCGERSHSARVIYWTRNNNNFQQAHQIFTNEVIVLSILKGDMLFWYAVRIYAISTSNESFTNICHTSKNEETLDLWFAVSKQWINYYLPWTHPKISSQSWNGHSFLSSIFEKFHLKCEHHILRKYLFKLCDSENEQSFFHIQQPIFRGRKNRIKPISHFHLHQKCMH